MDLAPIVIATGIVTGSFYALVSVALQITYGSSRVLNFAQGELVVAGMFFLYFIREVTGVHNPLSLLMVIPLGAALGVIFGLVAARPLLGRHFFQLALGTLSAGLALRGLYAMIFGTNILVVPPLISAKPVLIAGAFVSPQGMLMVLGAVLTLGGLYLFFRFSWAGLAMRATAENQEGAEVTGVEPRRILFWGFGLSGAVSALAGALMAPVLGIRFDFGLNFMLFAFVAAVLGGLSSPLAAGVGGFILGMSVSVIAGTVGARLQAVWLLLVLLPILYFRPHGVFGRGTHD